MENYGKVTVELNPINISRRRVDSAFFLPYDLSTFPNDNSNSYDLLKKSFDVFPQILGVQLGIETLLVVLDQLLLVLSRVQLLGI